MLVRMMGKMALSTSALRHPDGSRRWAGGVEWANRRDRGEGRGGRQVKADGGRASGTRLSNQSLIVWLMCKQHTTAADGSHLWQYNCMTNTSYHTYRAVSSAFWLMDLWCASWNRFFTEFTSLYHKCVVMFFFFLRLFPQCCNWASGLYCPFPPR